MDFAKAFDKVSHKHLIHKLNFYGIQGKTLNWITDFLKDRTQTVLLEGETSDTVPVTSGVPQGTVLGPILFLIYINDLPKYLKHSTLRRFADDSIMHKEINTINDKNDNNYKKTSMPQLNGNKIGSCTFTLTNALFLQSLKNTSLYDHLIPCIHTLFTK